MNADELAKLQLEAWKTTVQVQQHFNDIEMKIRALAITVLTAVLGAAAVAIKDGTALDVFGLDIPLGSALLVVGLVTWTMFWGVDQFWYHRLLIGAVRHGEDLEALLGKVGAGFDLTKRISKESPSKLLGMEVHSKEKLRAFYWGIGLLLLLGTIFSWVGTDTDQSSEDKNGSAMESVWKGTTATAGDSPGVKVILRRPTQALF